MTDIMQEEHRRCPRQSWKASGIMILNSYLPCCTCPVDSWAINSAFGWEKERKCPKKSEQSNMYSSAQCRRFSFFFNKAYVGGGGWSGLFGQQYSPGCPGERTRAEFWSRFALQPGLAQSRGRTSCSPFPWFTVADAQVPSTFS